MTNEGVIINRVAQSGIITFNLEDFFPQQESILFDIKEYLFMGLILKEKDFRAALKTHDWTAYTNKNVAIICSADAIVPLWAYMLLTAYLEPHANKVVCGDEKTLETVLFIQALSTIDPESYRDKRVVIKGCGKRPIPAAAYTEITRLLKPVVKSLMYGEPCSTVPIYKQPRKR